MRNFFPTFLPLFVIIIIMSLVLLHLRQRSRWNA